MSTKGFHRRFVPSPLPSRPASSSSRFRLRGKLLSPLPCSLPPVPAPGFEDISSGDMERPRGTVPEPPDEEDEDDDDDAVWTPSNDEEEEEEDDEGGS